MLQFIIQGRGGQGAQMAGEILAAAFFTEGKYVQAYATYGGARRGMPVSSFVRVDDSPIRLRCDIEHPNYILCFDQSLLFGNLLKGATEYTTVLINSVGDPSEFSHLTHSRVVTVDALAIAHAKNLGRIVNSVLVGAFAALLGAPAKDTLAEIVAKRSPVKVSENVNACLAGYEWVAKGVNSR